MLSCHIKPLPYQHSVFSITCTMLTTCLYGIDGKRTCAAFPCWAVNMWKKRRERKARSNDSLCKTRSLEETVCPLEIQLYSTTIVGQTVVPLYTDAVESWVWMISDVGSLRCGALAVEGFSRSGQVAVWWAVCFPWVMEYMAGLLAINDISCCELWQCRLWGYWPVSTVYVLLLLLIGQLCWIEISDWHIVDVFSLQSFVFEIVLNVQVFSMELAIVVIKIVNLRVGISNWQHF